MKLKSILILRKKPWFKAFSLTMAFVFLYQIFFPTVAWALTSGPGQQEFASFEPAGTSDMVDLYSGDFTYNIPLLSVPGPNGGYPINLAYHSGVGMEEEASWVGLGWNLNVGAIGRQLRGLPDDFNSDEISYKLDFKPSWIAALDFDFGSADYKEVWGFPAGSPQGNTQIYYNNYKGIGFRVSYSLSPAENGFVKPGLGLSYDSQGGLGVTPSLGLGPLSTQATISARRGLQSFGFSLSVSGAIASRTVVAKDGSTENEKKYEAIKTGGKDGFSAGGSFLSFPISGFPKVTTPTSSSSFNFTTRIGLPDGSLAWGVWKGSFPLLWSGSYSINRPTEQEYSRNAYGYLYAHNATDEGVKDFTRDEFNYSKKVPALPSSQFTYDLFSITGQGIGGMVRPHRSDVGILSSNLVENEIDGTTVGAEFAATAAIPPPTLHVGIDYQGAKGNDRTGPWVDGNTIGSVLGFEDRKPSPTTDVNADPAYEPYYFQIYGEKNATLVDDDHLSLWEGDEAVRMELAKTGSFNDKTFSTTSKFVTSEGDETPTIITSAMHFVPQRQRRATNIETYTNFEVGRYNRDQQVSYMYTDSETGNVKSRSQTQDIVETTDPKSSHITHISILKPDGMRYNYGLPAYNTSQKESLFSVQYCSSCETTFDMPNTTSAPVSASGTKDEFISETNIPAYVHSWLLTSIVSNDYIDKTGNGPSEDDYGYWVRFNYKRTSDNYHWRVPYKDANFTAGYSNHDDDKASFTSGTKELYYIESIETKTHKAFFNLYGDEDVRKDGLASNSTYTEGGSPSPISSNDRMHSLRNIELYAKSPLADEFNLNSLIKTVEFRYSYDLCDGVPNSEGGVGKLTLDSLYFTNRHSNRGRLSPYVFYYAANNPSYNKDNMDRWGNFRPACEDYPTCVVTDFPYHEFPYTDQRGSHKPIANAWSLEKIQLPTGGELNIEYESDDYAYVENKPAMRMYDITGLGSYSTTSNRGEATTWGDLTTHVSAMDDSDGGHFRVYFDLYENMDYEGADVNYIINEASESEREEFMLNKVIGDSKWIYFKVLADLMDSKTGDEIDYVSGYAQIITAGHGSGDIRYYGVDDEDDNGEFTNAFITLKKVQPGGNNMSLSEPLVALSVHPIRRALFQHLKVNRSELLHTVSTSTSPLSQILNLVSSIGQIFEDIICFGNNFNTCAVKNEWGKEVRLNGRSIIRLYDEDGFKYGGGSRVKKLTINDKWENPVSTTENESEYGQEYSYQIEENGKMISSGVAYEPTIGREESPLVQPMVYSESTPLTTPNSLFLEKPYMEKYYPGPSVGYRKVTVRSIAPAKASEESSGYNELLFSRAPVTIHEFYTPKEFPVKVDITEMNNDRPFKWPIGIPGVSSTFIKRQARTQGYSIVLNDMAGKVKSVTQFKELADETQPIDGNMISKQKYIYQTVNPYKESGTNELSNKVQVLMENGNYQTAIIGQTHDIFIDMTEDFSFYSSKGLNTNLETSLAVPWIIPVPLPQIHKQEASLKTVVTNKVIYRTGILKRIETQNYDSKVVTENLAYDLETSEPALTKTTNEFENPIYNYSYPAHWYYAGMGRASENWGVVLNNGGPGGYTLGSDGKVTISGLPSGKDVSDYFNEGDEVYVAQVGGNYGNYTITEVNDGSDYIQCIKNLNGDINAYYLGNAVWLTGNNVTAIVVTRSGKRNNLTNEAGKLVAQGLSNFDAYDPADASGTTFNTNQSFSFSQIIDASAMEYSDIWHTMCCDVPPTNYSKYSLGIRGIWRPKKFYQYVDDRDYSSMTENLREMGFYSSFSDFNWANPAGSDPEWINENTVTKYSPYGFEVENQDVLKVYSAAKYGYENSLVTAVGYNTTYNEMHFQSFEDVFHTNYEYMVNGLEWANICYTLTPNLRLGQQGFGEESQVLSKYAHTGHYGLQLLPGEQADIGNISIKPSPLVCEEVIDGHTSHLCDCLNGEYLYVGGTNIDFVPIEEREYYLSVWVKDLGVFANIVPQFTAPRVDIRFKVGGVWQSPVAYSTNAYAPIIDNWQKIEGSFEVPENATNMEVLLKNTHATGKFESAPVVFDDLRIHPIKSNMKSYVYDLRTFDLIAELDENNYATFYNYDEEGKLTKVRKETARGIRTLNEGRMSLKHVEP